MSDRDRLLDDLELLEKARIIVDDKAFAVRGATIPFGAILHIELSTPETSGTTEVAAWHEQRAVARIITDDRMHDPVLMEMGVRVSSSDGEPPEFDASRLALRVRHIAEAAARVAGKKVVAA
jgi:hypothetical protein